MRCIIVSTLKGTLSHLRRKVGHLLKLDMRENLQAEIVAWANATFTQATDLSSCAHLKREVREFNEAILQRDGSAIAEEAADIVMILMHITGRFYDIDLLKSVRAKLEVNKGRVWGEPDSEGVVEHI